MPYRRSGRTWVGSDSRTVKGGFSSRWLSPRGRDVPLSMYQISASLEPFILASFCRYSVVLRQPSIEQERDGYSLVVVKVHFILAPAQRHTDSTDLSFMPFTTRMGEEESMTPYHSKLGNTTSWTHSICRLLLVESVYDMENSSKSTKSTSPSRFSSAANISYHQVPQLSCLYVGAGTSSATAALKWLK